MLENESKMYSIFYLDAKLSERGISNMRVARLLVITEVIMIFYSVHIKAMIIVIIKKIK